MTTLPARKLFGPQDFTCKGSYKINGSNNGENNLAPSSLATTQEIVLRFALPRSTTTDKGSQIASVNVGYRVGTNNLTGITTALRSTAYAPGPTTATVPTSNSGFGVTAGSDYKGVITVTTPAFDNTGNPVAYEVSVIFRGQIATGDPVNVQIYFIEVLYTSDFTA